MRVELNSRDYRPEELEEAKKRILTMSLLDYAANNKVDPASFNAELYTASFEIPFRDPRLHELASNLTLIAALRQIKSLGIEAVVAAQPVLEKITTKPPLMLRQAIGLKLSIVGTALRRKEEPKA